MLPTEIGDAAQDANRGRVIAWLDAGGGSINDVVAGVRKYGTYKKYVRAPHRDVLAVRGLAQRGKLATDDSVLSFLARRADNGVVWHVLEYWRATN